MTVGAFVVVAVEAFLVFGLAHPRLQRAAMVVGVGSYALFLPRTSRGTAGTAWI
ncbi:MAG TPA: hypothetical protein VF331_28215 [Polyangiales bacterium]|jgi:hypothetical protein